jgi:hypothetical protein
MPGSIQDIIETLADTIQSQAAAYGKLSAGMEEMHRVHGELKKDHILINDGISKLIKKLKAEDGEEPKGFWGSIKGFFEGSLNKIIVSVMLLAVLIMAGAKIPDLADLARALYGLPAVSADKDAQDKDAATKK